MAQHALVISLPFRKSSHVDLEPPIRHYVENQYGQDFVPYAADARVLEKMRTLAIQATDPHVSAVNKLQAYAAQLAWMEARFPIDMGVEFTWFSTLGYNTSQAGSHASLKFDLINILYNLAALYSHLACSAHDDTDDFKSAYSYFCLSAGILRHLQTKLIPELKATPPTDMDPWTLESLENLMRGQAQECFWKKAIGDRKLKDASIARMAAAVAELYASAADIGTKSDGIRSEWLHHMKARHYHFMAAAQYRMACDNAERNKHGEEVARLQDGLDCVNTGIKESRYVNDFVVNELYLLRDKLQDDLKRAEKDNDKIYYQAVPPKSELAPIEKLQAITFKIPPEVEDPLEHLGEKSQLGKRLFENLVPYAVHEAQSQYEVAKTKKVNDIVVNDLERLNREIQDLLKALDLPGALVAVQQPQGVPDSLLIRAEEMRQQNATDMLKTSIKGMEEMKLTGQRMFSEAVNGLHIEADEDSQARRKFGTDRWPRLPSDQANPALFGQIKQLEGWLDHARQSDALILKKVAENGPLIDLLAGPAETLELHVPNSANVALPQPLGQAIFDLQSKFQAWHRIEARRKQKVQAVRQKAIDDNIYPILVREATRLESESVTRRINIDQLTSTFSSRLAKYDSEKSTIDSEEASNSRLINDIKKAHSEFVAAKKGDTSSRIRAQVLQSLDKAYFSYKEIRTNLEGAKRFYKDFLQSVEKFRNDGYAWTYKRRAEAAHIYSELAPDISTLNITNVEALRQEKEQEGRSRNLRPRAPKPEPMVAPQPKRASASAAPPAAGMWDPSRGIQFGGPTLQPSVHVAGGDGKATGAEAQTRSGEWDPTKGIKFN